MATRPTSTTTPSPGASAAPEDALRFTFVEMLFALAVSQVAMSAADLASLHDSVWKMLPAIFHLILCVAVIATSWVGWRRSQSPGAKPPIASIFGLRFVELLIDVALVILYFILVKSIEIEQVYGSPTPQLVKPPSATPEAGWICVIFGVYVAWDLIADVLSPGCLAAPLNTTAPGLWKKLAVGAASTCSSIACLVLSLIVVWRSQNATSVLTVVILDVALLCVVLLFRVLKTVESPLSRRLGVEQFKAFSSSRSLQTGSESMDLKVSAALVIAYALCVIAAPYLSEIGWLFGH